MEIEDRTSDQRSAPPAATPSFLPTQPAPNRVLSGPLGLRAGWGLLVFFILAIGLGVILFAGFFKASGHAKQWKLEQDTYQRAVKQARAAHRPAPMQELTLEPSILMESAQACAVLLAAFGVGFLEKRRFGVYGLGLRHLRDFLPGAGWGLAAIAVLVGCLRAAHLLVFDSEQLHGAAVVRFGLLWLLVFLTVGIFEEFFFRGYIQFTLTRGLLGLGHRLAPRHARRAAFWLAAVMWSLFFAATHLSNVGEDPVGIVMVFVAGVVFSYALWRTGSLWWGVGFHMTWDWGQSFLFGVPDSGTLSGGRLFLTHARGNPLLSGGGTGPEGSIFAVVALLLVAGVIRLHPQRAQPPVEPEAFPLVPRPQSGVAIP